MDAFFARGMAMLAPIFQKDGFLLVDIARIRPMLVAETATRAKGGFITMGASIAD